MNKKNIPSIVLYIFAGLLLIYTVWSFVYSKDIISEAVKAGQISIWGNMYDVVSFYMANCIQYFIYALLLFAVGLHMYAKPQVLKNLEDSPDISKISSDDEGYDSWYEETEED